MINKVNKELCEMRSWPKRDIIGQDAFDRVISGNYVENHPVDQRIMIALKGYENPMPEPGMIVASPS